MSALDKPINTSEFFNASSKLLIFTFFEMNSFFSSDKSSLFEFIGPLLSNIMIFFFFTPRATYILAQDIAAAPAPHMTILIFSISFLARSNALISAAPEIIAVPC